MFFNRTAMTSSNNSSSQYSPAYRIKIHQKKRPDSLKRQLTINEDEANQSLDDDGHQPNDDQVVNEDEKSLPVKQNSLKTVWHSIKRTIRSDSFKKTNSSKHASNITNIFDLNQKVVINVSGLTYETWAWILERHPTTLLGSKQKRKRHYDHKRKEYFFDRYRPAFESIFNYYQLGGKLKRPINVPDDIFLNELEFYEIEKTAIDEYKRDEGHVSEEVVLPELEWKRNIWMLFEFPETSVVAFGFAVLSVVLTIISIILFCIETLPTFRETHCVSGSAPNFLDPFFILETICTFWFTVEIGFRFLSCPSRTLFAKDLKNIIDLAAVFPYYFTLSNVLISFSCDGAKNSASLAFLRVIRLIRVFKLTKHSSGLQVLMLTFRASAEGLGLFLVALSVSIILFSSMIYYVEVGYPDSQISSIPDAFWWAIITMCTVGYGDKVPAQIAGKLIGSLCALCGVLTLAIPVPIITENFNKFYAHKTGRIKG